MNRFSISPRILVAAAIATAGLGAATVAEAARPQVFVSVDFQSAPRWVEPARSYYVEPQQVYVQPRPVFVQPAPVYVRPPVYEVYGPSRFGHHAGRFEWERERAWRHAQWNRHDRHDDFRGWDRDRNDHHGRHDGR